MATRKDPFLKGNFLVEIDGISDMEFTAVTGISSEIEVSEYAPGGATTPRKLAGITKHDNIVLSGGVTGSQSIEKWYQGWVDGKQRTRKTVDLVSLDAPGGKQVARWRVVEAWPCKLKRAEFEGGSSDPVIFELELAHEGCTRIK